MKTKEIATAVTEARHSLAASVFQPVPRAKHKSLLIFMQECFIGGKIVAAKQNSLSSLTWMPGS
jgi:hypothetical protein